MFHCELKKCFFWDTQIIVFTHILHNIAALSVVVLKIVQFALISAIFSGKRERSFCRCTLQSQQLLCLEVAIQAHSCQKHLPCSQTQTVGGWNPSNLSLELKKKLLLKCFPSARGAFERINGWILLSVSYRDHIAAWLQNQSRHQLCDEYLIHRSAEVRKRRWVH